VGLVGLRVIKAVEAIVGLAFWEVLELTC